MSSAWPFENRNKQKPVQINSNIKASQANDVANILNDSIAKGSLMPIVQKTETELLKGFRHHTPTLGEQVETLRIWWSQIESIYVKEHNRYEKDQLKWIEKSRLKELPLEKVYDFMTKKHVVKDRQNAIKLVQQ